MMDMYLLGYFESHTFSLEGRVLNYLLYSDNYFVCDFTVI